MSLNESKNQLFSIISHDLRSPLNSIVQVLELQKENTFSPKLQEEIFRQLHLQAHATSKMLNDLLNWANIQMDGKHLNFEQFDAVVLAESVVDFYKMEMAKKEITCSNKMPDRPLIIKADVNQVRIIIQNILKKVIT
jgi:signal transduction histidine kinase